MYKWPFSLTICTVRVYVCVSVCLFVMLCLFTETLISKHFNFIDVKTMNSNKKLYEEKEKNGVRCLLYVYHSCCYRRRRRRCHRSRRMHLKCDIGGIFSLSSQSRR